MVICLILNLMTLGCRITGVHEKGDHLEIESFLGKIQTRQLIYATHIPPGVNLLHFRCAPYRSYAMGVKLKNNKYPEGLAYYMYNPYHYYRTQEVDGQKYLIAGAKIIKLLIKQTLKNVLEN